MTFRIYASDRKKLSVTLKWDSPAYLFTIGSDWTAEILQTNIKRAFTSLTDRSLEENGFYLFQTRNGHGIVPRYCYLGQTYDRTLKIRIPEMHDAFKAMAENCGNEKLEVAWSGYRNISTSRENQEMFDDVELCLAFENTPHAEFNIRGREFNIKRNIDVDNIGAEATALELHIHYKT
jgi:hypothetical protein